MTPFGRRGDPADLTTAGRAPDSLIPAVAAGPDAGALGSAAELPATAATVGERRRRVHVPTRTFEAMDEPAFRWFLAGLLSQWGAMNMQTVVSGFLVYELTGSFAALGAMSLANAVPMLLLALVGGVVADRVPKRYVMQATQLAALVIALTIGILLSLDLLRFEHLFIASIFQGVVFAMYMPAQQSMAPEIVGRARLMSAIGLTTASQNIMRLTAPAVGGVLLAVVGGQWVYYLMAATYVAGIVALARVPGRPAWARDAAANALPAGRAGASGLADLKEGLRYVAGNRIIFMLLAVNIFLVLASMPYMAMLPGFVKDVLHAGPDRLGMLVSLMGAGSLVSSLAVASLPNRRRGRLLLGSALLQGFALIAFSGSTVFWAAAPAIVVVGMGQAGRMSLNNVLLQSYVDDAYRGRVTSIYMMEIGLMSLGTFIVGVLASLFGVQYAIGGTAVVLVLLSLGFLAFASRLRNLD